MKTLVEKPSPRVEEVPQLQHVQKVQTPVQAPRHGSPAELTKGRLEKRESPVQHKDLPAFPKSKDSSFVHAPVRQMVKVYGSSSDAFPVHREGPRSDTIRPKTELYREPPMLYLKGENGSDLNSRTRSSLPFSISSQATSPRPEVLMRPQGGANSAWRDLRDPNQYHSAKTLDRRDNRMGDQSPLMAATTLGPYRASWADSEGRGTLIRPGAPMSGGYSGIMARESPQGDSPRDRYKAVSVVIPSSDTTARGARKGTSRTLDNSDLPMFSEEVKRGKDGTVQRAPPRDRKMLKFISGIFTKSTPSAAPPLYPPVERGSSEEEAACTSSQEWTMAPTVLPLQELHLGVLGSLSSGKSALVHRHMTGSYLSVENTDGRQCVKDVQVDGQSHVLIIREETELPGPQFACWVDAVILVFSLENESSFQEVYKFYHQLALHRPISEIAFVVVGTQDKISSSNPRVIDDVKARQLCSDVRRCTYYETCATYGLNVNRVFNDAAQKIMAAKKQAALLAATCKSLPNSPTHSGGSTPVSGGFPGQASNGGQSSDYSSSLPSTPVISHKDICKTVKADTPGSIRSATRRRTPRFAGRRGSDSNRRSADSSLGSGRCIPIKQVRGTVYLEKSMKPGVTLLLRQHISSSVKITADLGLVQRWR